MSPDNCGSPAISGCTNPRILAPALRTWEAPPHPRTPARWRWVPPPPALRFPQSTFTVPSPAVASKAFIVQMMAEIPGCSSILPASNGADLFKPSPPTRMFMGASTSASMAAALSWAIPPPASLPTGWILISTTPATPDGQLTRPPCPPARLSINGTSSAVVWD